MNAIGSIRNGVGSVGSADHPAPAKTESKDSAKLHEMSKQFEAMFVRQILTAAKIGGGGKQNAYGGMGVDALATGITDGQGLGLAREIEDTVRRAEGGSSAPAPSSASASASASASGSGSASDPSSAAAAISAANMQAMVSDPTKTSASEK